MTILKTGSQLIDPAPFLTETEQLFCTTTPAVGHPPAALSPEDNTMNRPTLYQSFLLAFAALLGTGLATGAQADTVEPPYATEIRTCIDEVYAHIDLAGVDRVRHYVAKTRRSRIGYALYIDTTVFDGDTRQQYASYCLASGTDAPVKFEIESKAI